MAGRRMFARTVVCTGRFVDLPDSAQALYFQLGMNADDDGFAEGALILRMCRKGEEDLRLLEQAGLVRVFGEDLITYLVDWRVNNQIRKDRYQESPYAHLLEEAPASSPAVELDRSQEEAQEGPEKARKPEEPAARTPGREKHMAPSPLCLPRAAQAQPWMGVEGTREQAWMNGKGPPTRVGADAHIGPGFWAETAGDMRKDKLFGCGTRREDFSAICP